MFKLIINGTNILTESDVYFDQCWLDTYAQGISDTLSAEFGDPQGLWASWGLKCGDTIAVEGEGGFNSGNTTVSKITKSNQKITIIGRSASMARISTRYKKWQDVRLSEIGSEIAGRLGLSFENYGVADVFYDELIQDGESDLAFFNRLLTYESAGLLVFDGKLVIYDKASMEASPVASISFGVDGDFCITSSIASDYASCTLHWVEKDEFEVDRFVRLVSKDNRLMWKDTDYTYHTHTGAGETITVEPQEYKAQHTPMPGTPLDKTKPEYLPPDDNWFRGEWYPPKVEYEGSASAPGSLTGAELYISDIRVTSNDQASRWAKGILRAMAEKNTAGWITQPLMSGFSAGSVISCTFETASELNGNYFIDHIYHDIKEGRSRAYVHRCLGW